MTKLSRAMCGGVTTYCDLLEQRFSKEMDRMTPEQEAADEGDTARRPRVRHGRVRQEGLPARIRRDEVGQGETDGGTGGQGRLSAQAGGQYRVRVR